MPPSLTLPSRRPGAPKAVHSARGVGNGRSATSPRSMYDVRHRAEPLATTRRNTQHFAIACDTTSTLPIVYNSREHG
ncbi:hypothetical protein PsYK624_065330 [Phanerochaete sordida]|uniref:Uncharacterized protein n=1 Tax=Phanerochaete sordida TaxID=48140 RepID=A0A9P3LDX9_9APHY|nr:hypothetical protein PsYK624_065330 [Phanerochaete sordida]